VADRYDALVVGGGAAGCALAARLSEEPDRTVCLVEAGPDYGAYGEGRWPEELLDAGGVPETHEWDPDESWYTPLRARVIGGCSSHNACLVVWGAPQDYDAWGPGWTFAELEPYLRRAQDMLAPEPFCFTRDELSPWFAGVVEAGSAVGLPLLEDFNDPNEPVGIGLGPFNVREGVRWNAAFAYLDPARGRPNLTVLADRLVGRVVTRRGRALGLSVDGEELRADQVIIAAGSFGSPALLLRSGIGPERDLAALGIEVVAPLAGVGANLADHCSARLVFEPGESLRESTRRCAPVPFTNGEIKARSRACADLWDLHLLPVTSRTGDRTHLTAIVLQPESRGRVSIRSSDPEASPVIEHGFLSDPEGHDLRTLLDGLELAERLAQAAPLRRLARPVELERDERIRSTLAAIFHPVGTCAIGTVVDADGGVYGVENLYVADASIMPAIPRANTALTTLAIAERIAATL
jgi:choline dehydrogenase-like flavoprotein